MKNVTTITKDIYYPFKGLIFYKTEKDDHNNIYVESYDMDDKGRPINARPLNVEESEQLSKSLQVSYKKRSSFLECKGLLPENVLFLNSEENGGCVLWYNKAKRVQLYFKKELGISNGLAYVPALLWKASKEHLQVFALDNDKKPNLKTELFHAPFFNVYSDGGVCMGTVNIEIEDHCGLIDFMKEWEKNFFNSYFSHTMDYLPVKSNIIQLWKEQIASKRKFPIEVLTKQKQTLKDLLP